MAEPSSLRPTIVTVARKAGVSISTVSRALRHHPLISKDTIARVEKAAAEVGYSPNPYVSTLMSHLRMAKPIPYQASLALLDTLDSPEEWKKYPVQRDFHNGAADRCIELGYQLERFWALAPGLHRERLTRMLLSRGIRGVILPPLKDFASRGSEIPLELGEFACVTVGCRVVEPALHFSTNDQFFTGQLAHEKLLEKGYTRVGLVIPDYVECIVERRFSAGFRNALERSGRSSGKKAVLRYDRAAGPDPVLQWFDDFQPDAVCTTFREVGDWLAAAGIRIPRDVALASLDWTPEVDGWSGVDQESRRVGAAAIDLLVQMLQRNEIGPPGHPVGMTVEGRWVDGETTPKPKPAETKSGKSRSRSARLRGG